MKKHFIITLIFFICLGNTPFLAQRYSMDAGSKKRSEFSFKKIFRSNPAKKKIRQDNRKIKKSAKYEKKAIKKYWKTHDHPEELGKDQRVYKRMKKNLKKSDRINQGKHPDNFFKRMFWPKRETKRVKEKKSNRKFRLWKKKE